MTQLYTSIFCLSDEKFQIGEIVFDERRRSLIYQEKETYCSRQAYRLLSSFIHADEYFLSNSEIINVCGWSSTDIGLNEKRRTAVKYLRKQLRTVEIHICIEYIPVREGYQLLVVSR